MANPTPISATRLAAELADRLPTAVSVAEEAFALVERVRDLVEAVVMTDVSPATRAAAAERIAAVTDALRAERRDVPLLLVRHSDGRVESLLQAGSGRLNPRSPPLEWVHRPTEPPPGSEPTPVEVTARCTFGAAHAGSPGRVHGSVLAGVLDEVTGIAIRAAGAGGMTVALNVSFKGGVPIGAPVQIAARFTGREGRKSFASGEVTVEGTVMAEAAVIYVAERT